MNSIVLGYIHLIVLLLLSASFINACQINYKLEEWQDGREFLLSKEAPMTKVLNTIPGTAENAQLLLDHIRNVENAVYYVRQTEQANFAANSHANAPFETCNVRDTLFGDAAFAKFGAWGWPFADTTCVTDHFTEVGTQHLNMTKMDGSKYTIEDIHVALSKYKNTVKDNAKRFAAAARLSVSRADAAANHEMSFFSGEKCVLQATGAVRFDETWYLRATFTIEILDQLTDGVRKGIAEFPTLINGKFSSPKKMCMRVNNETHARKEGTTHVGFLRRGGGRRPSMFGKLTIDQNPSVKAALDKSDNFIQQANDALAPSNIAILVLPLFLNLVPIALLSTVTTSFMLFYTLLTDILTVVPLGVKGAELISIGSLTHRSVVVRISSSVMLPRSGAAAAELWSTECYAPSNVHRWGTFFLVLSLVFMIVGIMIEISAQAYMKRKRANIMNEFQEVLPLVNPEKKLARKCR